MRTRGLLPRLQPKMLPVLFACEQEGPCQSSTRGRFKICSHANKRAPAEAPAEDAPGFVRMRTSEALPRFHPRTLQFCSHANKETLPRFNSRTLPILFACEQEGPCEGSIRGRCQVLFACEQDGPAKVQSKDASSFCSHANKGALLRFNSMTPRVLFACEQRGPAKVQSADASSFVRMRTRRPLSRFNPKTPRVLFACEQVNLCQGSTRGRFKREFPLAG